MHYMDYYIPRNACRLGGKIHGKYNIFRKYSNINWNLLIKGIFIHAHQNGLFTPPYFCIFYKLTLLSFQLPNKELNRFNNSPLHTHHVQPCYPK